MSDTPQKGGIVMRAAYYERKERPGYWIVWLNWGGKSWKRSHYDDDIALIHQDMAIQIASAINADIKRRGKNFDPRRWFRTRGYEYQFSQYAQNWLAKQTHYAPTVIRGVHRYVGYATEFFGKIDIREIRKGDIEDFLTSLPEHLSPKTRRNVLGTIHKIFSDGYDREDIDRIPGWPKVSVPEPEIRWISREWQDKIIENIPKRHQPIFRFLQTYGCRPGEARALMWDCVDFEKGTICIKRTFSGIVLVERTKTSVIHNLPLLPEIADMLKPFRGIGRTFVFINSYGNPYRDSINRIWRKAQASAGAPNVTLYQGTRHSKGSQLISEGHSIELVKQLFGHSIIKTTEKYSKADVGAIRKMLQA